MYWPLDRVHVQTHIWAKTFEQTLNTSYVPDPEEAWGHPQAATQVHGPKQETC